MSSIDSTQSAESQQPRGIDAASPRAGESADSRLFAPVELGDGWFRRFVLERVVDVSGISGTGVVAWGVIFPTGKAVMAWRATPGVGPGSMGVYDSLDQLMRIHGHNGATVVRLVDRVEPVFLLDDEGKIPTAIPANDDEPGDGVAGAAA